MNNPLIKFTFSLFCKLFFGIPSAHLSNFINFTNFLFFVVFIIHELELIEAQNFGNCDFSKELIPGTVYTFTSPNYNKPYPAGTFCRYTGVFSIQFKLLHE